MLKKEKLLPVNILKIPHHGSKGSLVPALYEETSPDWAVISVGANNRFGHPSSIVLQELAQRGIKVLRTDQDGAISVRSDGRFIKIEPYRKKVRDIFKASWQYGLSHHPGKLFIIKQRAGIKYRTSPGNHNMNSPECLGYANGINDYINPAY